MKRTVLKFLGVGVGLFALFGSILGTVFRNERTVSEQEVVASFADWLKVLSSLEITDAIDDLRALQIRPFDHAYDGQKVRYHAYSRPTLRS